ncbi:MAG: glycerol-3-phosphate dehydrogenase/oxidase [Acidimicrobiia bacterium]|nr:glycerol-3-phosphate dehydrogenase/oxidase [Acidimicrobiia bacterium]
MAPNAPGRAASERSASLQRLGDGEFDVLVIGGGITGAGCALDAASRGLRTALVERDDFASGTSSKSSKLVHGGIRYLQQKEFALVYEGLHERQLALRNAPHLVRVLPFLIPILTRDGLVDRRVARALGGAMWMYDLTGGIRIKKTHKRIDKDEALRHMPTLRRDNLASAYLYYDARADDARLTLAIARTAAEHGATVANYAPVTGLLKDAHGNIRGARVEADGSTIEVRARVVINATGVWSDQVRTMDEGADPASIRPAKGIHITVPWAKVRNDIAAIVPVPKDKRSVFVVPWGDSTYVGTTDTDYDGPIDDPQCTPDDIAYLLRALNFAIEEPVTTDDVVGTWAGLRPLLRSADTERTADLSRRHGVRVSESGVITITGGKLTTYRRMAADTVDQASRVLGRRTRCRTKKIAVIGAEGYDAPPETMEPSRHEHLSGRYGTESQAVLDLVADDRELDEALVPGLPYLRAEAVHAVRHEMARTLDDVLSRRTRARLLARDASAAAAESVAMLIGPELGWDADESARQVDAYRAAVKHERESAGLPETALDASLGA